MTAVLAFDRENMIVAALIALMVAGLVVSYGAMMLLRRERRDQRSSEAAPETTNEA